MVLHDLMQSIAFGIKYNVGPWSTIKNVSSENDILQK